MKIAIVIGHNRRSRGAVSVDGTTEFDFNNTLATMIQSRAPDHVRVFSRPPISYPLDVYEAYDDVNQWGADCSIELHFNGATSPRARGVKTLSSGTKGSMRLAGFLHAECLGVMQRKDRGIESRSRHQRGGASLWSGKCPAVMAEPFFGSNAEDWRRGNARIDYLADAIYRAARNFCQRSKE